MGRSVKRWAARWVATVDMADVARFRWVLSSWYEDLKANKGDWTAPGFHVVALYRFGVWARAQSGLIRLLVNPTYMFAYRLTRIVYGVDVPRGVTIGRRLRLPHAFGIVVSREAVLGDDCMLRQGVTIGRFDRGRKRVEPYSPKLGNGVEVGAGAVIVGGVTVGDGARIGPNTVVMTDVTAGASVFARPSDVLGPLGRRDSSDA